MRDYFERRLDDYKDLDPPPVLREYYESVIDWVEDWLALAKDQEGSEMIDPLMVDRLIRETEFGDSLRDAMDVHDGLPSELREIIDAHDC